MTTDAKDLLAAAMRLDPAARASLAAELLESLEEVELLPEWEAEIQRRADDLDSGRVATVAGPEALERARRRIHGG